MKAMKPIVTLSLLVASVTVGTAIAFAVDALALPIFSVAASVLILLITMTDYAPRREHAAERVAVRQGRGGEKLPLAA